MKKGIIMVLVVLLLLGSVACNIKPPVQTGVFEDDYEMDISGDVVFTFGTGGGNGEIKATHAFIRAFEKKYPNVNVELDESPREQYATRISAGDIGDVFWCDETDAAVYKKQHNALMMLDYYFDKLGIDRSNIFNGAFSCGLIDGRLYMVPRNLGQQVLIYNADAVSAAGITMPSGGEAMPWDSFKEACKKLTIRENGKVEQVGACLMTWWGPIWQAFAAGWGGQWYDTINKKVSFVSDANVMKGFSELYDACTEGWMMIEGAQYTGEYKYQNLADYQRVFRTFGDMQWITSFGNSYDNKDIAWDFCSFPAFPVHKVCANATGFVVYNRTRNADAAATLALFFLTEEGQEAYHSTTGGNVPLLKSQANSDFWRMPDTKWSDKNFDAFVSYPDSTILGFVVAVVPFEIATIINDDMVTLSGNIVNGKVSLEDGLREMEQKCNEVWSKLTTF